MVGDMYRPKYAAAMIHEMLQPKHKVFTKQQYNPINNWVPINEDAIVVEEIEDCEANNKTE